MKVVVEKDCFKLIVMIGFFFFWWIFSWGSMINLL